MLKKVNDSIQVLEWSERDPYFKKCGAVSSRYGEIHSLRRRTSHFKFS